MLDVSGAFMYTLPRTPLRGGSKEKARVKQNTPRAQPSKAVFNAQTFRGTAGPQRLWN